MGTIPNVKKVILHIGRHKTGTSSLQNFFRQNQNRLLASGYYYPESGLRGVAHHEVANALTRKNIRRHMRSDGTLKSGLLNQFRQEINSASACSILVSSEIFQQCNPVHIRSLFSGFDVFIVVYLRDQNSYLASSYAQRVHAGLITMNLSDYFESVLRNSLDYWSHLQTWERVFESKIGVSIYDRSSLIDGDIVKDFCTRYLHLGDEIDGYRQLQNEHNPTLTNKLLLYKLFINRFLPKNDPRADKLYGCLATLTNDERLTGEFRVPGALSRRIASSYSESNGKVSDRYLKGRQIVEPEPVHLAQDEDTSLNHDEFDYITEQIRQVLPDLVDLIASEKPGPEDSVTFDNVTRRAPVLLRMASFVWRHYIRLTHWHSTRRH